ncbi:glutamate racemase [Catenibacillus scindens]|uniref:Glutamate racemase n=1 Tax=Catenibacillus scindens TaxID=673271 RepID=A0A7W8M440_9FIRM|nr:glutamate racemase [Catenibacillus scindens]
MVKDAPIGVFDSGVGGLTVVREIIRQLPSENVVYFGDTARVPYGSKSQKTIIEYTRQIIHFLKTKHVKAIVIACNTASAYALDTVAPEVDVPIIGVVRPGAYTAACTTSTGNIGVIGTEGTINSGIYTSVLHEYNPSFNVIGRACPLFVPLVEEGLLNDSVTDEIASRYLKILKDAKVDTLILGCTHYPLIRSTIRRIMGEDVNLVNPAYETAISLRAMLKEKGLYRESGEPHYRFFVSDGTDKFSAFANSILPVQLIETRLVPIDEY